MNKPTLFGAVICLRNADSINIITTYGGSHKLKTFLCQKLFEKNLLQQPFARVSQSWHVLKRKKCRLTSLAKLFFVKSLQLLTKFENKTKTLT